MRNCIFDLVWNLIIFAGDCSFLTQIWRYLFILTAEQSGFGVLFCFRKLPLDIQWQAVWIDRLIFATAVVTITILTSLVITTQHFTHNYVTASLSVYLIIPLLTFNSTNGAAGWLANKYSPECQIQTAAPCVCHSWPICRTQRMPDACLGTSLAAKHWTQRVGHTCMHVSVCMQRSKSEESTENVTKRKYFHLLHSHGWFVS